MQIGRLWRELWLFEVPYLTNRFPSLHQSDPVSPAVTWSASCAAAGSHAGLMSHVAGDVALKRAGSCHV